MRAAWQAMLFLLVVIFSFLIYKLPAKFVYQQFTTNSSLQLVGISGSIWSGHVEQIRMQQLTLTKLDWQLPPFALLFGEAEIQWQLNDPAAVLTGELLLSSDSIVIKNTHGNINVSLISQRVAQQNILFAGNLNISLDVLEMDQEKILEAVGFINWQQAGLLAPETIFFGGFKANLAKESEQLVMQLSDSGGAVSLSGRLLLTRLGAIRYTLRLGVRDTSAPGLIAGFNQLGRRDTDGMITIRDSFRLF